VAVRDSRLAEPEIESLDSSWARADAISANGYTA
jgi:hypothetical protein